MMNSSRNRFPFTPSQWQELELQALIFKYMASGIPVPPDLLFSVKRSCMDSKYFPRPPPHIGWSCFQMGLERKIDPEPGRCRRTDGKKWRCSKEAYPDSKYCERHMHRGKNRSRKPVESNTLANPMLSSSNSSTASSTISHVNKNPSSLLTSPSPSLSLLSPDQNYLHYTSGGYHGLNNQFLSSHASRSPVIALSPQDNNSHHLLLDNAVSCSLSNSDYRNRDVYGMKEEIGEHAFFSEPSGSMRNLSGSSMDEAWQLSPLTMSSSSSTSKQRNSTSLHHEYSYLQLQTLNDHNSSPKQQKQYQPSYASSIKEGEPQKTVHRFFDEWPPKNKDSWLDVDDKSSNNNASVSTTMLSISIPSSSHDFPIFNSRAHNDG